MHPRPQVRLEVVEGAVGEAVVLDVFDARFGLAPSSAPDTARRRGALDDGGGTPVALGAPERLIVLISPTRWIVLDRIRWTCNGTTP